MLRLAVEARNPDSRFPFTAISPKATCTTPPTFLPNPLSGKALTWETAISRQPHPRLGQYG